MINFLLGYLTYNPVGVYYLSAAGISLSVGLAVLLNNPSLKPNWSFFLITLTGSIWLFTYGLTILVSDEKQAFNWIIADYIFSTPFISVAVYQFSLHWTGRKISKFSLTLGWIIGLFFSLVTYLYGRDLFTLKYWPWGRSDLFRSTLAGITYFVALQIFFFIYAGLAFINFYQDWRNAVSTERRSQARNFLIAFVIGYVGSLDFYVGFGANMFPVGSFAFSLFIVIVAYSIIRHRFFNIDVLRKKITLLALIYSFLLAILFPALCAAYVHLHHSQNREILAALIALAIGTGFTFSLGPIIYAYLVRNTFWLKERVTTGLTHELKSPIGAIQGATDVLLSQLSNDGMNKANVTSYVQMIQRNSERLECFVKDLLHVAKIQDQGERLNESVFDASAMIRNVVDGYAVTAATKNISVKTSVEGGIHINGDSEKLLQVTSNLLSNALKFMPGPGTVRINAHKPNGHFVFTIEDEGPGIAKKDLPKIFERFYQGKNVNKGSGIGLTIAKAWVEAHGGKIWAESEGEGKGTKVTFTLPAGDHL